MNKCKSFTKTTIKSSVKLSINMGFLEKMIHSGSSFHFSHIQIHVWLWLQFERWLWWLSLVRAISCNNWTRLSIQFGITVTLASLPSCPTFLSTFGLDSELNSFVCRSIAWNHSVKSSFFFQTSNHERMVRLYVCFYICSVEFASKCFLTKKNTVSQKNERAQKVIRQF